MNSFSQFLDMGGYGAFVWPAYGLTAVVLLALLIYSLVSWRMSNTAVNELQQSRRRRRPGARSE